MAFGDTLSLACKDCDDLPFGVSLISALGHLQSLVDDRFGAVRLGLLRGNESSNHRRDQA